MTPSEPSGRSEASQRLAPSRRELLELKRAAIDSSYVSLGSRRTLSRHEFYRYPARFTPDFARAAIRAFSTPEDTVLDPFVGGGTTAVEAQELGRRAIVSDINPLATFVTRVKTTAWSSDELEAVEEWALGLDNLLRLGRRVELPSRWVTDGYFRNLNGPEVWRIRNMLALAVDSLASLPPSASDLARCAILRTGQWAVDMTSNVPSVQDFRSTLLQNIEGMVSVAAKEASAPRSEVAIATEPVPGLHGAGILDGRPPPRLILTSPPYPGVYVLYHRWKVLGRRETPAPYWITNSLDGNGLAHYTMGNRFDPDAYFLNSEAAFRELTHLLDRDGWLVQMVGFKDVDSQLGRYLDVMESVGLEEVLFDELATRDDGRLWRDVPHRRWWTQNDEGAAVTASTAEEVVLIHRRRG